MKVSGDTSFRLMKQFNSSLLRVREGDGQLTVGDAGLDRERLCGQAPQCVLAFDVVSFSQEQFRLVHVEVEVRDINDHAPRFPRAQIPVEVSEGAAVGTRIPLEVPVDEDVGANGLQSVRLAEPHSPFRVELQTRADDAQCADLVLLQELDRESQAAYSLELVAQDGGRPPRSATAALSVRVLDANDHSPAFPQGAVAEVELAEDAPVGSLLLDLDAADPDESLNGDVVFTFGARTRPEARHLCRLDPRSGRLTLAGPVDYERQDTYELDVRAQDRGPGPWASTCKVIVRIRDVNDNAPDIAITPLAAPGAPAASPFAAAAAAALGGADATSPTGPGTPEAGAVSLVPEGAARESLVALVSTSDRDSGANGQVRCALYGHEHFRLQPAYAGSYLVVTAASLDRERIAEYNLTLVAEDRGAPPLRTVRPYTVRVSDENDNAPLFTRPVYEVSVRENNPPGAYLATVAARDPDLGRNGQVTYRLLEAEVGIPLSLDEFSVKDNTRGDSELNDSNSDINIHIVCFCLHLWLCSNVYPLKEIFHASNCFPNCHSPPLHSELKGCYFQVCESQSEGLPSIYDRVQNCRPAMSPPPILRQNDELNHPSVDGSPSHTSEIATSF
ncbi:unnamed protein product [Nyctereutes procyonoides]|uniref:(raccoon dog) hypothetical protein n=1 Tax=Nyctereutes procyonoides TaxID=34880 RepID=A0A811YWM7_NYCPR|nr:unnamed protein product [Nyctereutes procyonoides]